MSPADPRYRRVALVLDAARSSRLRPASHPPVPADTTMAWRMVLAVRSRARIAEHAEVALALGVALACLWPGERGARRRAELEEELRARYGEQYEWWLRRDG